MLKIKEIILKPLYKIITEHAWFCKRGEFTWDYFQNFHFLSIWYKYKIANLLLFAGYKDDKTTQNTERQRRNWIDHPNRVIMSKLKKLKCEYTKKKVDLSNEAYYKDS